MRVLVLTSADRALDNRSMWQALGQHAVVDVYFLDKAQQRNLRAYFARLELGVYQRIVLDLMFKHIHTQGRFLRTLPALTLYEEDGYLDTFAGSRWQGRFLKFYRAMPALKVICTGYQVARHFREAGVDSYFIPKGFDPERLQDQHKPLRDIDFGFIGRLGSATYSARRAMLQELADHGSLRIMRTHTAEEYQDTLNRIGCFVSADIGLGEYMAKNFEAMACGCLLIAKRQGQGEEQALGFVDGDNLLLYEDLESLRGKVAWVRLHPQQAREIARRGREHVLRHNTYARLAAQVAQVIVEPFSPLPSRSWWRWC